MSEPSKYVVRAVDCQPSDALRVKHPFNPASEIHMKRDTASRRRGILPDSIPNQRKARGSLIEITRAMFQAFEATKDISCRCYLSVLTELES